MPTKCCWMIHGSLTSERKASTSPSSFINHSTLLLNRALKRQAPILFTCTSKFERSTGSERVDALTLGLRAAEVIIRMITRDFSVISMTSQASLSLSLSLPLTKVTDAQYRKRFRASYNKEVGKRASNLYKSFRTMLLTGSWSPWSHVTWSTMTTPLYGELHLYTFPRICWRSSERRMQSQSGRRSAPPLSSFERWRERRRLEKFQHTPADREGLLFQFLCSVLKNSEA